MILKAYRSDHPGSLLALPIVVGVLWLASFLHATPPPAYDGMPLYEGIASFLRAHPWSGWLGGALLALIGSLLCIGIARDLDFPDEHGNIPPLLYPLLIGLFPSSQWAHPTAFAELFLIFAFWRLMKTQKGGTPTPYLFDAGFSIGIASMFHLPFCLFFPFLWIASVTLRSIGWRDIVWPLIGLLLPFLFLIVHHYWTDQLSSIPSYFEAKGSAPLLYTEQSEILSYALWSLLAILFLIGLFLGVKEAQNSNMQGKRLRRLFFLSLPFACAVAFYALHRSADPLAWSVLAFPLSFLFTPFFSRRVMSGLASFAFYLWLLLLLLNDHFSSYF